MCRGQAAAELGGGAAVSAGRELLPANVVPTHYDITLEPDFQKLTFDGTVVIDLDCAEDSRSVALHTLEIDIHSVNIAANGATIR